MRPYHAFQHLPTLAGLWIGNADVRYGEFALGIVGGIGGADPHARMIDRTKAAPLKKFAQLEDLGDRGQGLLIAALWHHPAILVLYFAATRPRAV